MKRILVVAAIMSALPAFVVFIAVAVPLILAAVPKPAPQEPIHFDHSVHVQTVGLECAFCHRTADKAMNAGYPDVQQCMFCHQVVAVAQVSAQGMDLNQTQDELSKIREAWRLQQPVNWQRIHRLPDHVQFVHEAHINAGLPCATCHGDVGSMGQVVQVRPLGMGDCLSCHKERGAPTECAVCHK
jgi:hypothetical protein